MEILDLINIYNTTSKFMPYLGKLIAYASIDLNEKEDRMKNNLKTI